MSGWPPREPQSRETNSFEPSFSSFSTKSTPVNTDSTAPSFQNSFSSVGSVGVRDYIDPAVPGTSGVKRGTCRQFPEPFQGTPNCGRTTGYHQRPYGHHNQPGNQNYHRYQPYRPCFQERQHLMPPEGYFPNFQSIPANYCYQKPYHNYSTNSYGYNPNFVHNSGPGFENSSLQQRLPPYFPPYQSYQFGGYDGSSNPSLCGAPNQGYGQFVDQLGTLDGVQCGVPTLTTPTLTPTTQRNIQQTFLQAFSSQVHPPETHTNQAGFVPPVVHPQPGSTFISIDSKSLGGGIATLVDTSTLPQTDPPSSTILPSKDFLPSSTSGGVSGPPPPLLPISGLLSTSSTSVTFSGSSFTESSSSVDLPSTSPMPSVALSVHSSDSDNVSVDVPPTRRMGGRRPANHLKLSQEEEEKRKIRRERNKLAAARCRKRRLDQTMTLQEETDQLEGKKSELQNEIQVLKQQKEELEFLLAVHKSNCNRNNNKTAPTSSTVIVTTHSIPTSIPNSMSFNNRFLTVKQEVTPPSSISIKEEHFSDSEEHITPPPPPRFSLANPNPPPSRILHSQSSSKPNRPTTLNVAPLTDIGVSIETPSAGIRGLNFESMMEGGTGLTPVTPLAGAMVSLATGLTPLTTPIISHPSASVVSSSSVVVTSSGNCGHQLSSSSELSSPDSMSSNQLVSL